MSKFLRTYTRCCWRKRFKTPFLSFPTRMSKFSTISSIKCPKVPQAKLCCNLAPVEWVSTLPCLVSLQPQVRQVGSTTTTTTRVPSSRRSVLATPSRGPTSCAFGTAVGCGSKSVRYWPSLSSIHSQSCSSHCVLWSMLSLWLWISMMRNMMILGECKLIII